MTNDMGKKILREGRRQPLPAPTRQTINANAEQVAGLTLRGEAGLFRQGYQNHGTRV
jgi:hypothetical protein